MLVLTDVTIYAVFFLSPSNTFYKKMINKKELFRMFCDFFIHIAIET